MTISAFARRLERIEAAQAVAGDIRYDILAARQQQPKPSHTRAELKVLADTPGMIGRIARGWLRIGFALDQRDGVKAAPEINPDTVLLGMAGYFYDKPLAFVLFAYEWDEDHSLHVVKLPQE